MHLLYGDPQNAIPTVLNCIHINEDSFPKMFHHNSIPHLVWSYWKMLPLGSFQTSPFHHWGHRIRSLSWSSRGNRSTSQEVMWQRANCTVLLEDDVIWRVSLVSQWRVGQILGYLTSSFVGLDLWFSHCLTVLLKRGTTTGSIWRRALLVLSLCCNQGVPPAFFRVVRWSSTNSAKIFNSQKRGMFKLRREVSVVKNVNKTSVLNAVCSC